MRKTYVKMLILFILLAFTMGGIGDSCRDPETGELDCGRPTSPVGSITGRVTDAITGRPLKTATVQANNKITIVRDDGTYDFYSIPIGTYFVTADCGGYEPQTKRVDVFAYQRVTVNFALYPSGGGGGR